MARKLLPLSPSESMEESLESRSPVVPSYGCNLRDAMDFFCFAADSASRELPRCALVQRPAEESIWTAANSYRSRVKTVCDKLQFLSWKSRGGRRQRSGAIQGASAVGIGWRGFLVYHHRVRSRRHAVLGPTVRTEPMANCHLH